LSEEESQSLLAEEANIRGQNSLKKRKRSISGKSGQSKSRSNSGESGPSKRLKQPVVELIKPSNSLEDSSDQALSGSAVVASGESSVSQNSPIDVNQLLRDDETNDDTSESEKLSTETRDDGDKSCSTSSLVAETVLMGMVQSSSNPELVHPYELLDLVLQSRSFSGSIEPPTSVFDATSLSVSVDVVGKGKELLGDLSKYMKQLFSVRERLGNKIETNTQPNDVWIPLTSKLPATGRVLRSRNKSGETSKQVNVFELNSDDDFESTNEIKTNAMQEPGDVEAESQDVFADEDIGIRLTRVPDLPENKRTSKVKEIVDDWKSADDSEEVDPSSEVAVIKEVSSDCPICGRSFRQNLLEKHASDCQGLREPRQSKLKLKSKKPGEGVFDLAEKVNASTSGSSKKLYNVKSKVPVQFDLNVINTPEKEEKDSDDEPLICPSPVIFKKVRKPPPLNIGGAPWADKLGN